MCLHTSICQLGRDKSDTQNCTAQVPLPGTHGNEWWSVFTEDALSRMISVGPFANIVRTLHFNGLPQNRVFMCICSSQKLHCLSFKRQILLCLARFLFILKPCRFDILKKEQFYLHICKHRPASTVVCHSPPSVIEPAEVLTVLHLLYFSSSNISSAWQEPKKLCHQDTYQRI